MINPKNTICCVMLVLFSLVTTVSFAQIAIRNDLTPSHKSLLNGKVYLNPPTDFETSDNFMGFNQKYSGASVVVADLPIPYQAIIGGFAEQSLVSKGIEVKRTTTYTINEKQATLFVAVQEAHGQKYVKMMLLMEGVNESILVTGSYPGSAIALESTIKKSVLSIIYDDKIAKDPMKSADFDMNVSAAKLKPAKAVAGSIIFNASGEYPSKGQNSSKIVVAKSNVVVPQDKQDDFIKNRIDMLPFDNITVQSQDNVSLSGLPGKSVTALYTLKEDQAEDQMYVVFLFSDTGNYFIYATTNQKDEKTFENLKKSVATFKLK